MSVTLVRKATIMQVFHLLSSCTPRRFRVKPKLFSLDCCKRFIPPHKHLAISPVRNISFHLLYCIPCALASSYDYLIYRMFLPYKKERRTPLHCLSYPPHLYLTTTTAFTSIHPLQHFPCNSPLHHLHFPPFILQPRPFRTTPRQRRCSLAAGARPHIGAFALDFNVGLLCHLRRRWTRKP